ncbi:MAG: hypothetical protein HOE90_07605 [Bacteriovoracaceae bacterium]|nr:hypothetical protein [Bacteriovoracaceae bacterium]
MKKDLLVIFTFLFVLVGCGSQSKYNHRHKRLAKFERRKIASIKTYNYGSLRKELAYFRVCIVSLKTIQAEKHNLPLTCDGHLRNYYKGSADLSHYGRLTLLLNDLVSSGFEIKCDDTFECLAVRQNID